MRPENPYRKGSVTWSVMEGDWEDLTIAQIAEVLDTSPNTVYACIQRIRKKTGYEVPYTACIVRKKQKGGAEDGFQKH